ncbi:hypothetical protein [Neobacillus sp. NPDC093127]|uniref:hypothetical protein n=1 Tax=Neobacillus sp. NPDC093127 TaxID=3364296 RepID=UPI003806C7C3
MAFNSFQEGIFELLQKMATLYQQKSSDKIVSPKIQRGTKSPISGAFEEEFTKLLANTLEGNYYYIIDFQLSKYYLNGTYTYKHFRPDVLILEKVNERESIVRAVFELKIDISYASDYWVNEMKQRLDYFTDFIVKFRLFKTKLIEHDLFLEINHKNEPARTDHIILKPCSELKSIGLVLCRDNDHNRWDSVTSTENVSNVKVFYLSKEHLNKSSIDLEKLRDVKNMEPLQQWKGLEDYMRNEMNLIFK